MRQNPLSNISYDPRIDICLPVIFGKAFLAAALHKQVVQVWIQPELNVWLSGEQRFPFVKIFLRVDLKIRTALQKQHGNRKRFCDIRRIDTVQGIPVITGCV